MNFKKGDLVECWDNNDHDVEKCEYFTFNDHPRSTYPHLVRRFDIPGEGANSYISAYKHCRPARPDLKIDDPVWVRNGDLFYPHHFAGWVSDGRIKFWAYGKTSHTANKNEWYVADKYRLTPPDSDGSSE